MFGLAHMIVVLVSKWMDNRDIRTEIEKQKERFVALLCTYPVLPSSVHVCIYFE